MRSLSRHLSSRESLPSSSLCASIGMSMHLYYLCNTVIKNVGFECVCVCVCACAPVPLVSLLMRTISTVEKMQHIYISCRNAGALRTALSAIPAAASGLAVRQLGPRKCAGFGFDRMQMQIFSIVLARTPTTDDGLRASWHDLLRVRRPDWNWELVRGFIA